MYSGTMISMQHKCIDTQTQTDKPDKGSGGSRAGSDMLSMVTSGAAAAPHLNNPCLDASKPYQKMKWCDATLPIDERVQDMIGRMSLAEKIDALNSVEKSIDSLGLVPYNWWSEATHGISHVSNGEKTPYESNFAFPITTGMAFNRTLWKKTGAQIGREARAFMNTGDAWSTYWAPVINLAREPRWGRNIETPGEDPYLSGEYATAFVKGFEVSEDDPSGLQVATPEPRTPSLEPLAPSPEP